MNGNTFFLRGLWTCIGLASSSMFLKQEKTYLLSFFAFLYFCLTLLFYPVDRSDLMEQGDIKANANLSDQAWKFVFFWKKLSLGVCSYHLGHKLLYIYIFIRRMDSLSCTTDYRRSPALCAFWDLEKTMLHEIPVSGALLILLQFWKSPLACTEARNHAIGNPVK